MSELRSDVERRNAEIRQALLRVARGAVASGSRMPRCEAMAVFLSAFFGEPITQSVVRNQRGKLSAAGILLLDRDRRIVVLAA